MKIYVFFPALGWPWDFFYSRWDTSNCLDVWIHDATVYDAVLWVLCVTYPIFCTMPGIQYPDIKNSLDLCKLCGVSFGSLNICSLQYKIDDVMTFLLCSELDYSSLTETWLNQSTENALLSIPGYQLHRLDRSETHTQVGGGIVTYCRNHHIFNPIIEYNLIMPDVEWTWHKLSLKNTHPTYVATVYRSPQGNIDKFLDLLENKILDIISLGCLT